MIWWYDTIKMIWYNDDIIWYDSISYDDMIKYDICYNDMIKYMI